MKAIEVLNISKKFRITHGKEETLKGWLVNLFHRRKQTTEEFWALKNVSFSVNKGETLGVIGGNGSGKTTLLRVLAGIYSPTTGKVKSTGKISTLFELGTGFHPELSGRENIYLNGSILGLSKKEIDEKFNQILEFSELEKFIDTPIKHYSSGMQVRLAFSVAINVNPEILLVDEVLAVGDASFQGKSFNTFKEFKKKGITIVFVSHDIGSVQNFCDRVLVMKDGSPYFIGRPDKAALEYLKLNLSKQDDKQNENEKSASRKTHKEWSVEKIEFYNKAGKKTDLFETGDAITCRIFYRSHKRILNPVVGIAIYSESGAHITGPNTKDSKYNIEKVEGDGYIDYVIQKAPLLAGNYYITVGFFDDKVIHSYDFVDRGASFKILSVGVNQNGIFRLEESWSQVSLNKPSESKKNKKDKPINL